MENPREFTEDMKGFTLQFWNLIWSKEITGSFPALTELFKFNLTYYSFDKSSGSQTLVLDLLEKKCLNFA
jgi:hypothetical protein